MPKLMQQKNGQYLLTIPKPVVRALGANKGDRIDLDIDLKKGLVILKRKEKG